VAASGTHTPRSFAQLRPLTVDGRGVADIRLVQVEDGPGRGQRLLMARNATGIGFEIAVDRGFDLSSVTWRGVNIGWNSANALPWPPHSVDAEDGVGFYRNLDGLLVTCGLDHIGAASREDAGRYLHKHRKQVFHPLHGRVSGQRATLSGYGVDWSADTPKLWAEAVVRQSAVFGENLVLTRRVELDVFGHAIRIADLVENRGFRPTPHAILYHVNFGYPFLDADTELSGDVGIEASRAFNEGDRRPSPDFRDYYEEMPLCGSSESASIELRNDKLLGGVRAVLTFSPRALPKFGIWRAFQSGVYALALEPARPSVSGPTAAMPLGAGEVAHYAISLELGPTSEAQSSARAGQDYPSARPDSGQAERSS
jgi:hypothetical protein